MIKGVEYYIPDKDSEFKGVHALEYYEDSMEFRKLDNGICSYIRDGNSKLITKFEYPLKDEEKAKEFQKLLSNFQKLNNQGCCKR